MQDTRDAAYRPLKERRGDVGHATALLFASQGVAPSDPDPFLKAVDAHFRSRVGRSMTDRELETAEVCRLRGGADDEAARVIAKSLRGIGNALAWKTLSDQREAQATGAVAAEVRCSSAIRPLRRRRPRASREGPSSSSPTRSLLTLG
ncbi:hypothetical protein LVJ94_49105 [Pendulispora rubella]|uniref:HhH-GPD domain-containing protein n=1 Tax=Pendulispora rubella TaxID=2741070 RepID=A0ABZ2L1L8_9BACT